METTPTFCHHDTRRGSRDDTLETPAKPAGILRQTMKEQTILKAEAPSIDLLTLAAQGQITKAHVSGYTRQDGAKVKAHERNIKPTTPTLAQQARKHATQAARHELNARRYQPGHPRHGAHIELSALHLAACRHAHRAGDDSIDSKDRLAATQSRTHLQKPIAAKERDLAGEQTKPLTKAVPVLFRVMKKAQPRGVNLSNLIAEMDRAQALAKRNQT
jgi:hypothetical protein